MKRRLSLIATLILAIPLAAQSVRPADAVRAYRRAHEHQILDQFRRLLAIPNLASDRENIRKWVSE